MAIYAGSNMVPIGFKLKERGRPVRLYGVTVEFELKREGSPKTTREVTILNEDEGTCVVELMSEDISVAGTYEFQLIRKHSDGREIPSKPGKFFVASRI